MASRCFFTLGLSFSELARLIVLDRFQGVRCINVLCIFCFSSSLASGKCEFYVLHTFMSMVVLCMSFIVLCVLFY